MINNLILNIYDACRSNFRKHECIKRDSIETKHIAILSNLICVHALASLTRIELKHVYITSK